jgi:hypothetical protein
MDPDAKPAEGIVALGIARDAGILLVDSPSKPPPGAAALTLEVIRGTAPSPGPLEAVFDSKGLWRVSRSGDGFVFDLPGRRAIVDFDAGRGRIYMDASVPGASPLAYPLDEILFSRLLADRGALIVHAAGVDAGGRGLLFAGPSGSGKSTLAGLFAAADGAVVLSDDRVAAGLRGGRAVIGGTPWHGTSGLGSGGTAPLESVFFLRHAPVNRVEPLSVPDAAARLLSLSVIPFWDREAARSAAHAAASIAELVRAADLGFAADATAVTYVTGILGRLSNEKRRT